MRKGFKETLATVAIATLGFNAMAMAPTVGDIPDIIVGDAEHSSDQNVFVYEDAINLDSYVSDDETAPGDIIWSYSADRYTLNAVDSLDISTEDPIAPGAKRVDDTDSDPVQADDNPRTITIRDETISPVADGGGLGPYSPEPGPAGIVASEAVVVYASDGSTVGMGSFIIYSNNEGFDSFSPAEEIVYEKDFLLGADDWIFASSLGTVNESQDGTNGLCMDVPAAGNNDASWISPYDVVELVPNSVWEARMTVSTSQTTVNQTPLWVFVYDNFDHTDPVAAQNEYGGEMFYHDNENGMNSPIDGVGRSEFRIFMAPISYQVPHFVDSTNGFFRPGLDAGNDMRLQFRMFDYDVGGYNAQVDEGSVCFQNLTVIRHDASAMSAGDVVHEVTSFEDANVGNDGTSGPNGYQIDAGAGETNIDFSGGNVTLSSNGNTWDTGTVTLLRPGNGTDFNPSNPNGELNDLYPIDWEADTLYYIEYQLSAPTTADAENPPDVIRIGADVLTSELVTDHFLVPNTADQTGGAIERGVSMPRAGSPQTYAGFFYSHTPTASTINDAQRWRPRFEVLTSNTINAFGRTTNTGSVRVHSVKVQKVDFGG